MCRPAFLSVSAALLVSTAVSAPLSSGGRANATNKLADPPYGPWQCAPTASAFEDYCSKDASPKSFAMTADCNYWEAYHEDSDATNNALLGCKTRSGQMCYTYDNNGRNCFSGCQRNWPHSSASADWQRYCHSAGKGKAWYMRDDCSSYGYDFNNTDVSHARVVAQSTCEKYSAGKTCKLFDDNGATLGSRCLPACRQLEPEWCWATATAEIASYWNPEKFTVVGGDCTGIECQVASFATGKDCCADKTSCDNPNAINYTFIKQVAGGPAYTYTPNMLSEEQLQSYLALGPAAIQIRWPGGGAHYVTVGGVNTAASPASYFVHDPLVENQAGKYQDVSFAHIQQYQEPLAGQHGRYTGTWSGTVHVVTDGPQPPVVVVV